MKNLTDDAFTGGLCRGARGLLGWSQEDLARESGAAKKTVADFERGATKPQSRTLRDIRQAFERAGVTFIAEGLYHGDGGLGMRLRENPANAKAD